MRARLQKEQPLSDQLRGFESLRTPRLTLVRTTLDHLEALFQIHGDPHSIRYLPRELCEDLAAGRQLLTEMISVEERGQGFRWSILHQALVVGSLGFHAWNRKQGTAQLSYELIPGARGKGYAREAVAAVLKFGFSAMELGKVLAEAHVENFPSIHLLEHAGFLEVGRYLRVWKGGGVVWFKRYTLANDQRREDALRGG